MLHLIHSRKRGKYIIIMKVNKKYIFPGSFHTDLLPLHRRHCCGPVYRHLPARLQKPLHEVHFTSPLNGSYNEITKNRKCRGHVYRHLPARLQKPLHEVHLTLKWMVS